MINGHLKRGRAGAEERIAIGGEENGPAAFHPCHKILGDGKKHLFTPGTAGNDKLKEGPAQVHLANCVHLVTNRDMAVPVGLNCQPGISWNHLERGFPLRNCLERLASGMSGGGVALIVS